jgi:hypothetical protein
MECDPARLEVFLRGQKALSIGAKSEVEHGDAAARPLRRVWIVGGEQGQSGRLFTDENWDAVPHLFVPTFKAEEVDVPGRGAFDIADGQRHMVDSFYVDHLASVKGRLSRGKSRGNPFSDSLFIRG